MPAPDPAPRWYRVAGAGRAGAVHATAEAAWRSALRGVPAHREGEVIAAHNLTLYAATTRAAAQDADLSRASGRCGRGEWWLAP